MNRIGNRARRLVALAAVALVATLAAAETRAQRPAEGRYRSCAEAGRLQTPSTVPYNLTYAVVSAPLGGPIQLNVTVTPSANLARVAVNFATEGIVVLAAPSDQNLTNLIAGTPVTFPVTLNLTGVGGGALFANTRWFEITACGEEPREAEEFPFYVLYTGPAQYTGGSSLLELQVQDVNARLTAMTISAAQASFELDALLAAPLVSPLAEPVFAEGGAGSVSISGTAQWTDSGGGVHPSRQAIVKAFLGSPPATPLVEVGSTVASDAGAFTLVMANAALGASPRDIRVRVLSENFSTRVLFATGATPPMNGVYFLEKIYPAVADNTVITGETLTSGNATTQGRSFSVSDAMIVGNRYIEQVNGTTPALIVTNYPTTGAGTASFFDGSTLNIHPSKPFMWDVLLHEYGHYVASLFTLDNNPGGPHACSQNLIASLGKDNGSRLAWGEGLATYLGIAAQLVTNAAALNVPQAGDTSYHSNTAATGAAWQYDNEGRDSCNGIGEGVETNVSRALLDVADSAVDGDDVVADGHPGTWTVIKNAAAHNNLSDIWNAIISGKTTQEKINYGATFAQNKVSPAQTAPADGDAIDVMPPTFKWEKHTLNKFRVRFYSDAFAEVGASPELGDVAEWTPTQGEWDPIRAAATNGVLLWVVEGENTAAPGTGVYWSGARRLGGVDFAFIIDDTGSMSEEIDGVRNALLAFLSTFDPTSTAVRFQLTTFKDNVTVRPSTTNLATITADVSALSASGGGDCPEQSVGGVSQGTLAMKSGGTVLLATDADPRPGSDLNALIAALRARGARVNVLLSGTCFGSLTEDWRQQEDGAPFVEAEAGPEGIGFTGAIDAYTQLATATGGSFVFVPEVNNNAEGVVKYQAAAENILAASIGPKLISATPGNVMRGATATVLIDAQNTNFLSNTTVTFDTGVTATSVSVVDPVTLAVTVTVAADAPLGFKNATATTNLGGGATETATGAAILNVLDAPSSASLSSASPPIVTPGQTVDVVVTGVGTAFAAGTTTASFGAGVTVNSVTVTSPTTATVNVTVDPGASIGFRTVSLTTGAETASSPSTGFFRVDAVAPPVPTVTTIVPDNSAPATTFPINLTVTNATLDPGGTTVEFSGSGVSVSGVTVCGNTVVGTVTIAPTATPGFRDVIVRSPGSGTAASLGGFLVDGSATTAGDDDDDCGSCRVVDDAPARWHVFAGLLAAAAAAGFVGRRTAQRRAN